MKYLFMTFLVLNFLAETLAAVTLIGGPEGLAAAGQGGQWSMHYGFAALAIASASLWLWPNRNNRAAVTPVLGILVIFHLGLTVSLAAAGDQAGGMVLHAFLSVLALVTFVTRGSWCEAPELTKTSA